MAQQSGKTAKSTQGAKNTKNTIALVIGGASYSIRRPKQWTLVQLARAAESIQGDIESIDLSDLTEMIDTLMGMFRTDDGTKSRASSKDRIIGVLNDMDSDVDLEQVVTKVLESVDDGTGKGGR